MASVVIPPELCRVTESERPCSYLDGETAALEYRLFPTLRPVELEALISRGWRRFGAHVFRPACPACTKCIPIRIDVERFQPSKSQRRNRRRNGHVTVSLHKPTVSEQHIQLYNAWHADMTARRGWSLQQVTPKEYGEGFLLGEFPSAHEFRYFDGGKLIGIGFVDLLPDSLSSVYFFHDPHWRDLGPGTFSLLCEIDFARQTGRREVFLGYWIAACPSMAYKNRFRPCEVLTHRPRDEESPRWQFFEHAEQRR